MRLTWILRGAEPSEATGSSLASHVTKSGRVGLSQSAEGGCGLSREAKEIREDDEWMEWGETCSRTYEANPPEAPPAEDWVLLPNNGAPPKEEVADPTEEGLPKTGAPPKAGEAPKPPATWKKEQLCTWSIDTPAACTHLVSAVAAVETGRHRSPVKRCYPLPRWRFQKSWAGIWTCCWTRMRSECRQRGRLREERIVTKAQRKGEQEGSLGGDSQDWEVEPNVVDPKTFLLASEALGQLPRPPKPLREK